jgi:hypothetical protein
VVPKVVPKVVPTVVPTAFPTVKKKSSSINNLSNTNVTAVPTVKKKSSSINNSSNTNGNVRTIADPNNVVDSENSNKITLTLIVPKGTMSFVNNDGGANTNDALVFTKEIIN